MIVVPKKLLAADEPVPVSVYKERGKSPFLLVADHAGNRIPRALGRLGTAKEDCQRHIAWDIGVAGLGPRLANVLDATLIQQNYSRLVIDCNRALEASTSIADISENTPIPGNAGLSDCARQIRARAGRAAALISLHSFTPVFKGATRPWHAGVLYNRDARFAHRVMASLNQENDLLVGDNAPYIVSDASDYTIPIHAERRGLHHVLVEIRQDLIAHKSGQRAWALRLARVLPRAYQEQ
jgi:predicted N-formylglutamate amidohydrolase